MLRKIFSFALFLLLQSAIILPQDDLGPDMDLIVQTRDVSQQEVVFELVPIGDLSAWSAICSVFDKVDATDNNMVFIYGNSNCIYNGYDYKEYSQDPSTNYWYCGSTQTTIQPLRSGFYRLNVYVDGDLKYYVYYDNRDADLPKGSCYPTYTCYYPMRSSFQYKGTNQDSVYWRINFTDTLVPPITNQWQYVPRGGIVLLRDLCICNPQNFSPFWSLGLIPLETSNHHPRILWGPIPNNTYYRVMRKFGLSDWALLATVSSYEYTDNSVNIAQPGGEVGATIKYKVAPQNSPTWYTNEVTYTSSNQEIEKKGISFKEATIRDFELGAYPNPFNPSTKITFSLPLAGHISLILYDAFGRKVSTLYEGFKEAGKYSTEFQGSNLSAGVYFCRLTTNRQSITNKILLLK